MWINQPSYGINLLPIQWRTLQKIGNSKENYQEQLALDIDNLIETWINMWKTHGNISILDIWGNNASAIQDLKNIFLQSWIPKTAIHLHKIDLEDRNQSWIHHICWDLNYDDFLCECIEKLWFQSQSIIFCNQVTQYLIDRLKVIKFIYDFLLKKWWKFYVNMIESSFYSGVGVPFAVLESKLNEIMMEESSGVHIWIKTNPHLSGFKMYEFTKTEDDSELEMPKYGRIVEKREVDGFKKVAYDFRGRTDLEKLRMIIMNKLSVTNILHQK